MKPSLSSQRQLIHAFQQHQAVMDYSDRSALTSEPGGDTIEERHGLPRSSSGGSLNINKHRQFQQNQQK
jgi:hypothetical protein